MASQKPNDGNVEQKDNQAQPRRCSRLHDGNHQQSNPLQSLYASIHPPQGIKNGLKQLKPNCPTQVTNIKIVNDKNNQKVWKVSYRNKQGKSRHNKLYKALEKWGSLFLSLILEYFSKNGGKTNELFHDFACYIEQTWIPLDWIVPSVGTYVLIKGKTTQSVGVVSKVIAPLAGYSWEISDIAVIAVTFVNTEVKKSNTVVLCVGDGAVDNLCVFDYQIINIDGLNQSAIHGYLVIKEQCNVIDKLEVENGGLKRDMDSVEGSLWGVIFKRMRGQIQYRAKDKWRHGFIWFADGLWSRFINDIYKYKASCLFDKEDEEITGVKAPIEQYHKMYEREEFEKVVCVDGTDRVGTIKELEFTYDKQSKILSFAALVVVDND